MTVAFFDLDRTLLDCNSGRLWLRYEWREGRVGVVDAAIGAWWLLKYSLGNHDLSEAYASAVSKLAGQQEAEIAKRTSDWFAREVVHRLRPGAVEALAVHRARGDQLVLATSSSPYAAASAVKSFELDEGISSQFEVKEGIFTGRVASLALGPSKATRVQEWAEARKICLSDCVFYTDSMTDRALLELVGKPIVVNPDRPLAKLARERGWQVEDWGKSQQK